MATVALPLALAQSMGAPAQLEVCASDVRGLLRALDEQFPGIRQVLEADLSIAIDGEIFSDPLFESLEPGSEVHFLARLKGG